MYSFRYQIVNTDSWQEERVDNVPRNGTYVIQDIDSDESYNVYFVLIDSHQNFAPPVGISEPSKFSSFTPARNVSFVSFRFVCKIIIIFFSHKKKANVTGGYNNYSLALHRQNCRKVRLVECIFVYITLHFECQFIKNSLLQCYFFSVFLRWAECLSKVYSAKINCYRA